jgi:hypothetical protein
MGNDLHSSQMAPSYELSDGGAIHENRTVPEPSFMPRPLVISRFNPLSTFVGVVLGLILGGLIGGLVANSVVMDNCDAQICAQATAGTTTSIQQITVTASLTTTLSTTSGPSTMVEKTVITTLPASTIISTMTPSTQTVTATPSSSSSIPPAPKMPDDPAPVEGLVSVFESSTESQLCGQHSNFELDYAAPNVSYQLVQALSAKAASKPGLWKSTDWTTENYNRVWSRTASVHGESRDLMIEVRPEWDTDLAFS